MSIYYLDASAWVNRYLEEPGSSWMQQLFTRQERLASTGLGYLEVTAALTRQQVSRRLDEDKLRQLQEQLEQDWNELTGLPLTGELVDRAVELTKRYRLRGADALHLAAALTLAGKLEGTNQTVILVASDDEMREAARQTGLPVENPILA